MSQNTQIPHLQRLVSFFIGNIRTAKVTENKPVAEILKDIKGDRYKKAISEYREALKLDEATAKTHYKEKLPHFTVSGIFNGRRAKKTLAQHSGLIQIDIDGSKNTIIDLVATKKMLCDDEFTFTAFYGPSGDGVKLIVKTPICSNDAEHKKYYYGLEQYYFKKFGFTIDEACKDVSRAFFVSHDPELYLNINSSIFQKTLTRSFKKENESPPPNPHINHANITIKNPNRIVEKRVRQSIDNAIKLIKNAADGEKNSQLLKASQILGGLVGGGFLSEDEAVSIALNEISLKPNVRSLDDAKKTIQGGITWGKEKPFTEDSILDNYKDYLAKIGVVKENGLATYNPQKAKAHLNQQPKNSSNTNTNTQALFDEKGKIIRQIRQPVKSHDVGHSKAGYRTSNTLAYLIEEGYARDVHSNIIYKDGNECSIEDINSLVIQCKSTFEMPHEDTRTLLQSSFMPYIDCILDLKEVCEQERNYEGSIDALFDTLELAEPDHAPILKTIFKKWFVGFWANLIGNRPEDVNQIFLILSGDNTLGKSYFFKQMFYEIGLEDKSAIMQEDAYKNVSDIKRFARENFFCLFDDFEKSLFKNDFFFKNILSNKTISMVEKFQKNSANFKRIANFAGTTNETEFLYDTTYNRRIISINITNRDKKGYDNISKISVFAEAYHLYKAGNTHQINEEEVKFIKDTLSQKNKVTSITDDIILSKYSPGSKLEHDEFITCTQLYKEFDAYKISLIEFGRILNSMGFNKARGREYIDKKRIWGYYVRLSETENDAENG